jgi:hypothetical protein
MPLNRKHTKLHQKLCKLMIWGNFVPSCIGGNWAGSMKQTFKRGL